ncbi:hypothetical protein GCM10010389_33900 [Streptomyces echinoruber]|uniref:Uncharacterized protein n=1 Tax=Streptomyces echinoruber TaxID=68898 RepID=A0A918VE78_9ACTN|nr:hypothetical protein GCM10010389_33900 [Streptomyces echinoruber]
MDSPPMNGITDRPSRRAGFHVFVWRGLPVPPREVRAAVMLSTPPFPAVALSGPALVRSARRAGEVLPAGAYPISLRLRAVARVPFGPSRPARPGHWPKVFAVRPGGRPEPVHSRDLKRPVGGILGAV